MRTAKSPCAANPEAAKSARVGSSCRKRLVEDGSREEAKKAVDEVKEDRRHPRTRRQQGDGPRKVRKPATTSSPARRCTARWENILQTSFFRFPSAFRLTACKKVTRMRELPG